MLLVSNNSCCIVFNNRITRNFKIWFSGKKTSLESEMFRFRALLMYLEGATYVSVLEPESRSYLKMGHHPLTLYFFHYKNKITRG